MPKKILTLTLQQFLRQQLKDPDFCVAWKESAPAYELKRLRILKGWSQTDLARRIGTRQPSIARLESGYGLRNLTFLKKVADALDAQVEIRITPKPAAQKAKPASAPKKLGSGKTRKKKGKA